MKAVFTYLRDVWTAFDEDNASLLAAGIAFYTVLSLAPMLRQVFFIGDGFTSGAISQQFVIPVGATRLYLGTMDGSEWANNVGTIDIVVSPIPVPAAGWLFGSALGLLGMRWRNNRG